MGAVAQAVNVNTSALYRHFPSKPSLLIEVIVTEMTPFRQIFAAGALASLDEFTDRFVAVATDLDRLGTLWQQEARGLPPDAYAVLRAEVRTTLDQLTELIEGQRPLLAPAEAQLLAEATCSAVIAASQFKRDLPRVEFERVLRSIVSTILRIEPVLSGGRAWPRSEYQPVTRREQLLGSAATLFAERGYDAVSMEEVGSRAGVTGPTVHHHFGSKHELLAAVLERGTEWLWRDLYAALDRATPETRGSQLLRTYLEFVARHSGLAEVLDTEKRHLEAPEHDRICQSHRDHLTEWLALIRAQNTGVAEAEARIRLAAMRAVAHDIARTPYVRDQPGAYDTVERIGHALLFDTAAGATS